MIRLRLPPADVLADAGLCQRIEFFGKQNTCTGNRCIFGDTMCRSFCTVCCTKSIHDEYITQTGIFLGGFFEVLFSPLLIRQFSRTTNSPDATSNPPSTQSLINRTGFPSLRAISSATGWREFSSVHTLLPAVQDERSP